MKNAIGSLCCVIGKVLGGCSETPLLLRPSGRIDIHTYSSILLDKLEKIGDASAELYMADNVCRVYNKDDVVKLLALDETDKITFVAETMDCDDIAAVLYGMGLGLVWTTKHALNFFISDDNTLYFVEPQTDKISPVLEGWQGGDVRFFLSR